MRLDVSRDARRVVRESRIFRFSRPPALTGPECRVIYVNVINIHMELEAMADIAAKLDQNGKWAWIAAMVGGFILFWPVGLFILGYLIWSGRMGCWKKFGLEEIGRGRGRWYAPSGNTSSGNAAFDEYREETLKRLEEEQKEFGEYLERLRRAKDKSEFDQFMSDRRKGPQGPTAQA